MPRFDASTAECLVFTFKEGFLSALAHDLKIRVTRFVIEGDQSTRAIEARFDTGSLRVVCAVADGSDSPGTLTAANKREIEGNIAREVLDAAHHPEIRFHSTEVTDAGEGWKVQGRLAICGRERAIRFDVARNEGFYVARIRVSQPNFGIRPYTALFGTLKVKPEVIVRVAVPARAS